MLNGLDSFEKKIEVPGTLVQNFTNDMVFLVLQRLPPAKFQTFCAQYGVELNENKQITNMTVGAMFKIIGCYMDAVDNEFKYNGGFSQKFKQYQTGVAAQLSQDTSGRVFYQYMCEVIFQYSSPLYSFFEKVRFGDDADIKNHFSLLPPVLRYYVLFDFYGALCMNILSGSSVDRNYAVTVVDKLNLAIIKMVDTQTALEWLEKNRPMLTTMDMYRICRDKIQAMAGRPVDYSVLSEAFPMYNSKWSLPTNTEERVVFTNTVNFYYSSPKHAADLLCAELP